jgi:ABC-type amino acid transport system permease subunit
VRSTPFVILLFFIFYALPLALDMDILSTPERRCISGPK